MRKTKPLPTRFPIGSKYVLEARGVMVLRYVELPGGRRVTLPPRKAQSCLCASAPELSIVPGLDAAMPEKKKLAAKARVASE